MLPSEVEQALGELVALGLVASDSFGGLRALLTPSSQRQPRAGWKRRGRTLPFAVESGGRWAIVRRPPADGWGEELRGAAIEHAARTLLKRYGVVFWRLLAREPGWLPPWRELLRVYRRLEAAGEIRGGRFVAASPASNRRFRRRSRSCVRCAGAIPRTNGCRSPPPIRSISLA